MKNIFLSVFIVAYAAMSGQKWVDLRQDPKRNFYEIQSAFNDYWKDKDVTEKGTGFKAFKRWEQLVGPRVYPTGDLSQLQLTPKNFAEFQSQNPSAKLQASSTWTPLGPFGGMSGLLNGLPRNAGRNSFVTFHPSVLNTYWTGTPAGGLWKTTDNGVTWATNTDNLPVTGSTDMAIDPTNTNIMYMATGDGYTDDCPSIGVLKSTDGGLSWSPTGLTFQVAVQVVIRRVIIDPTNTQILLAATSVGVYRTTNAGANWTNVNAGNFYDVEFKPGNPNIVYASGNTFLRSTNNGANFSLVSSGIATSGSNRMEIGVSPADPEYVYVVASQNSNSSLLGVYRSVNSGVSFFLASTTPNLLGNNCNGGSSSGQGWYDLSIDVSPLNENEVVIGGVNVWRSTNSATNWSCIGCWNQPTNPPYIHADIHELEYTTGGTLYAACDGGIFSFNGSTWDDHTGTRNIAQMYKIGLSSLTPYRWITGHQDNGTNIFTGTSYNVAIGGDGMDCFFDRTNDNTVFGELYNGDFRRSNNGGVNWSVITTGLTDNAPWVTPWKQDPVVPSRIYAGRSDFWVSNNYGTNWSKTTNSMPGSGFCVEFDVSPTNNQVIYLIRGTSIFRTSNAGANWTNITSGVPVQSAQPSNIIVHHSDPNTAWVTLSGYSAGNKVYKTMNGGVTWHNISANLPNLPANAIAFQPGSNGLVYVGMDVGVYYIDVNQTSWTLYNTGLPNTIVNDLAISPALPNMLRAATYGRGVWEVDGVQGNQVPASNYTFSGVRCPGTTLTFTDQSFGGATTWNWSVLPASSATISNATAQNPSIQFGNSGSYTVSLIAGNSVGAGSTFTQVIGISAAPSLTVKSSADTLCIGDAVTFTVTGATTATWEPGASTGTQYSAMPESTSSFTVSSKNAAGCVGTSEVLVIVDACTGIKENSLAGLFELFPNPAKSAVIVKSKSGQSIEELHVLDVTGKTVITQLPREGKSARELTIDLTALNDGVYFVKIRSDNLTTEIKLIKE